MLSPPIPNMMMKIDYYKLPSIRTPRCLLRPVRANDAPALWQLYSNPQVIRYTEYHVPMRSLTEAQNAISFYGRGYREGWMYRWGVVFADSNTFMGTAGLHRISHKHHFANIGYEIDEPYWNQGLSTEIVSALTEYGFIQLNLHRIEAELIPQNVASARVLQKNHYRYEATRHQRLRKLDKYFDIDVYGILYDEWKAFHAGN